MTRVALAFNAPPPAAKGSVIGDNHPPRDRPSFNRVCPECAEPFTTQTPDKLFCVDAHKAAYHNRNSKIGRGGLVTLAKAWRLGRNAKGQSPKAKALRASAARAFAEMCRMIDAANAEDAAEGHQNALLFVRARSRREGTMAQVETRAFHEAEAAKAAAIAAKGGAK